MTLKDEKATKKESAVKALAAGLGPDRRTAAAEVVEPGGVAERLGATRERWPRGSRGSRAATGGPGRAREVLDITVDAL